MRVLAVDLGGTKTALARVEVDGRVHGRRHMPAARTLDDSVAQVVSAAEAVQAVGVIVPGIYSQDGRAWCPNLWGDAYVPLRDALQDRLSVPVAIDNDRAGYVLGEAWCGAARDAHDAVFVSVSTGIGVGLMANGAVVRGAHGIAGAAGWFSLDAEWDDVYQRCGAWETQVSGPALARRFGVDQAEAVVVAARGGDARACALLGEAAHCLGRGIANIISLMNPEVVVLGGGVIQGGGDLLIDGIRREAGRWAQPIAARQCRIVTTMLGEDAGLLGAARLALAEIT
jgi:glucokinase